VKAVREEEVKLRRVGFEKQVGFKPRIKESGVMDKQSGESKRRNDE